jgi:hypothetical protein
MSCGSCKERLTAFTPAILATIAVVCGTAGNMYCETMQFPQEDSDAILFAGVWSYRTRSYVEIDNEMWAFTMCQSYGYLDRDLGFDYDLDSKSRTVMAFSIMALFFGGLGVFFSYLAPCARGRFASMWKTLGNVFLFTGLLQGLTLLMQSSSLCLDNPVLQIMESQSPSIRETFGDECEWGPGYRLNITSVVFWFLAGLSTYVVSPPQVSASEPTQTQTVTYQRNPDGTVTETDVAIVKGNTVVEQVVVDEEKK